MARNRHHGAVVTATLHEDLNPAQQRAVTHPGGPLLILAGAGTGKTRTITRRVAHLVRDQGVPPARVLAITFTNKAANEMRQRIAQWVPHTGMWVGTFHATCARMLRMDPDPVGRTRDFTIVDTDDRRRLLRQLIKEQGWDPQVFRPRRFEAMISGWKQERMSPEAAAEHASLRGLEEEHCALVYRKYEEAVARQDGLDFDDLLLKGLQLLEHDARHDRRWTDRFAHVVVDEYQDTNEIQYELVRRWSSGTGNLAVCGDPDQSIYRWRGADIGNILRFDQDYPDAEVVRLERNYRSVGNVLKAAQHVIRHNRSRKEKDLVTDREDGPPIGLTEGADEEFEAEQTAFRVAAWIEAGTSAREVAVFYRTNACSRALEAAFTRLQIPYQIVGGLGFFERREIKDLIAYARLALNPRDDVAFERVVNVPPRGIGGTTLGRLRAVAQEHERPLLETVRREDVRSHVRGPARRGLVAFLSLMEKIGRRLERAEDALRTVLDVTGYRRYAEAMDHTEDVDRGENIDELLAFAAEYDQREEGGLRGFLEEIALLTDVDRWDSQAERVSLMTVHAAKGLEFDRVAVVGLEEGLFPHARAFEDPEGLEEERRLFYVALTRAREELLLSHARVRYRTGAPGPSAPSRFLSELPGELLPDAAIEAELASWESNAAAPEDPGEESATPLQPGDLVRHRVFGDGEVREIRGRGVNQRVVVRFDETGAERTLMLAYSMLEPRP